MEPLGATASVIAVAGLAAQSARAVYQVMDGLIEAPHAIANSKALVAGTQDSLNSLAGTLTTSPETQARFGSVLRSIDLEKTLKSTQELCDRFHTAITGYTRHSTDARFSNRDRMLVNLHEQQIAQFNNQLSGCQRTISLVIETITLIVTYRISSDVAELSARLQAQEQALSALATELTRTSTTLESIENSIEDKQASLERFAILQDTCEATRKATQAQRTGQTFGDMQIDQSFAVQGIVGEAQSGVDQSFGRLSAQNSSRGFQGQMDAASFARMFG
ncbi:hypothetical protein PG995_011679 [Apiospora arundinis]